MICDRWWRVKALLVWKMEVEAFSPSSQKQLRQAEVSEFRNRSLDRGGCFVNTSFIVGCSLPRLVPPFRWMDRRLRKWHLSTLSKLVRCFLVEIGFTS